MTYRILLIEDEQQIQQAISNFLERDGYHVYASETGGHGLTLFEYEKLDLILLDMMLPDISGEVVLKKN